MFKSFFIFLIAFLIPFSVCSVKEVILRYPMSSNISDLTDWILIMSRIISTSNGSVTSLEIVNLMAVPILPRNNSTASEIVRPKTGVSLIWTI